MLTVTGSCSCGNIQWTSTSAPTHLDYCYCLTCQRVSGAPFQAWMGVPKASLKWTFSRGNPFIYRSNVGDTDISVAERMCCGICGCNISLQYDLYPEKTHIAASTIITNELEMPKVGCHIWTRQVPFWHTIPDDGVERFREFDSIFQARLDDYLKSVQMESLKPKEKGGWWGGLMPGNSVDYSTTKGPDDLTMADLWNDPSKVKRPQ